MSLNEAKIILNKKPNFSDEILNESHQKLKNVIILKTSWYSEIVDSLERSALSFLQKVDVDSSKVKVLPVPGTLEMPLAFSEVLQKFSPEDTLIVMLGCIVKGGTPHFDIICHASFKQILEIQTKACVASGVGILTVDNIEQAKERQDKGSEAAQAAFEMFLLKQQLGRVN